MRMAPGVVCPVEWQGKGWPVPGWFVGLAERTPPTPGGDESCRGAPVMATMVAIQDAHQRARQAGMIERAISLNLVERSA